VKLYNFCIEISIYLGLDTRKCFTNQFILYEEGGKLQEYNTKDQDTVSKWVVVYLSNNSAKISSCLSLDILPTKKTFYSHV